MSEQFEDGNTAAVKHGAHSERIVGPVRAEVRSELAEAVPWLNRPEFQDAAEALADTQAKAKLITEWLEDNGLFHKGEPRKGTLDLLIRLRHLEMSQARELGLTPKGYSEVAKSLASAERDRDLTEARQAGRALRLARDS